MFFERHCDLWAALPEVVWEPLRSFVKDLDVPAETSARREIAFAQPANRILLICEMGRITHAAAGMASRPIFEHLDAIYSADVGSPLFGRALYRAELSFVGPGSRVLEHHDPCRFHQICHRLHVPIITNGSVIEVKWFQQNDWTAHTLRAGHLYQLNNRIPHRVFNRTDSVRVHLILDYAPLTQLKQWRVDKRNSHEMVPCRPADPEYRFIGSTALGMHPLRRSTEGVHA